MSIRMIAKDLYRLYREEEKLQKRLESAPVGEKEKLEQELRKVKAERERVQKILDGSKEPPPYRKLPR